MFGFGQLPPMFPQGGQGLGEALGAASPLLLSMSQGLLSGQGAMANAPIGLAMMMQQADKRREQKDRDAATAAAQSALGGFGGGMPASLPGGMPPVVSSQGAPAPQAAPAAASSGGVPKLVFDTLIQEGVPQHIAAGALANFSHESSFNPTAFNEGEGAFGLGQWRGDRLENLKTFAAQQGGRPDDPAIQAKFWVWENQGPEAKAWARISQSRTPGEAAAAIDQHYERSDGKSRDARVRTAEQIAGDLMAQYGGGGQVDPSSDPAIQRSMAALANPNLPEGTRQALQTAIQMRMQALQSQAQDRLDPAQALQLGLQYQQAEAGPSPDKRYQNVPGVGLVDLYAPGGVPKPVLTTPADPLSGAGKLKADLDAGRITQDQFDAEMSKGNISFTTDAEGNTSFSLGSGQRLKPLTEGQAKDNFYLSSIEHAGPILDQYETALTGLAGAANDAAGMVPVVGKFMQSPEYQVAQQAVAEWGAPILRKESGAALTKEDYRWLEDRYVPVPGEKADVIARKREARRAAEAGLRSGMNDEQINAVAKALASLRPDLTEDQRKSIAVETAGYPGAPKIGALVEGHTYVGGNPNDQASWVKR